MYNSDILEEKEKSEFNWENLPQGSTFLRLLGVDYLHIKIENQGDLYITKYGLPFLEQLKPENWLEKVWFEQNRLKLKGTSSVYKLNTREINNKSITIVVKWCRVGEEVPIDTLTLNKFIKVEFNTPYEEFSHVMEMRKRNQQGVIRTHKPLAIYVPEKRYEIWQTGRSKSKIAQKKAKNRDVELDIYRQYIMIYEWIKGISAVEALEKLIDDEKTRNQKLMELTYKVIGDLKIKGYRVHDMKPEHIIVRLNPSTDIMRRDNNEAAYALVDFELLERTPEYDRKMKALRRAEYYRRQHLQSTFYIYKKKFFPPHLHQINIFGVDYVYGFTESTHGIVWVVGEDPGLFDYFLPERWRRTPRQKLSKSDEIFSTKTKDNINLIWKVSRVGETPESDDVRKTGFNSPFEKFAIATELQHRGILTITPRAIYMTGNETEEGYVNDDSRYKSHKNIYLYDGTPVLKPNHNYITIWGYWGGKDILFSKNELENARGINLLEAFQRDFVDSVTYFKLLNRKKELLSIAGFEDLDLNGEHLLLTMIHNGTLVKEKDGTPEARLCNFEVIRRI